jgi:hypothetical protein
MMSDSNENPITPSELMEILQNLQTRVPGFQSLSNAQVISIRKAAGLNPDWVRRSVSILDNSPGVAAAVDTTHDALVAEIDDMNRWTAVETELKAFLKGVSGANLVRRHRIGLKALQIYGISRQLIRQPGNDNLRTFVESLQEMNKLGKRKKKE